MIIDVILEAILNQIRWDDASASNVIREKLGDDLPLTIDESNLIFQYLISAGISCIYDQNEKYYDYINMFDPVRCEALSIIRDYVDDTHRSIAIVDHLINVGLLN